MAKSNEVLENDVVYIKEFLSDFKGLALNELKAIKAQTIKTNGRVNNLESWQSKIKGGAIVAKFTWATFGTIFLGALFHMYALLNDIDTKIESEVSVQLSHYEVLK